jgi:hypothetical protein
MQLLSVDMRACFIISPQVVSFLMKTEHQEEKVVDPTSLPEYVALQERIPQVRPFLSLFPVFFFFLIDFAGRSYCGLMRRLQLKELVLKKPKEKERAKAEA